MIKFQKALSVAISGDKALTLEQLWSRLENQGTLASLKFVAHTLELPTTLCNLSAKVSMMHVHHACCTSKKPESIPLLLDWIEPTDTTPPTFIIPTGTPETPLIYSMRHLVLHHCILVELCTKELRESNAGTIKADEWRTIEHSVSPYSTHHPLW
ncbi:hypothetical protein BT96DRAFT_1009996 [Gymnopus androsaceus JB14]|uniref:Uncharacterized protein n=1 Tax=Gymnopus androsaceus JB14 TaxID=1447944 RepID=A0A6A4GBF5_9AGAR|nr:hypothetical protein BT96DRAFT_1009996 [Gymnopus androsaceus JB14]